MRVLLLGVTGKVGSRLLPSLVAHQHQVVAYVRNPAKFPQAATSKATAVVQGSGTDCSAIKAAILKHNCDAVVNAAGIPSVLGYQGDFPAIFASATQAAVEAHKERGGPPLRCWFLSGFPILDSPKKPYMLLDYISIYPTHRKNYAHIQQIPSSQLSWSLFCASNMPPQSAEIDYSTSSPGAGADNLIAAVDSPPDWSTTLEWVPLLGTYLSIVAQVQPYFAPLEDCVDFIARDLTRGLASEFVGKRVGVKMKSKVA